MSLPPFALTAQHSDLRRWIACHTDEIKNRTLEPFEGLKGANWDVWVLELEGRRLTPRRRQANRL